jgi:hypothetical protein
VTSIYSDLMVTEIAGIACTQQSDTGGEEGCEGENYDMVCYGYQGNCDSSLLCRSM